MHAGGTRLRAADARDVHARCRVDRAWFWNDRLVAFTGTSSFPSGTGAPIQIYTPPRTRGK
jgi:hypothetical protein